MGAEVAQRWRRSVPSLKQVSLRAAFMRSELARIDVEEAAMALDDLCDCAEQADPIAVEVLAAAMPAITDPASCAWIESLRQLARERALLPLGRLLRVRRSTPPGATGPAEPDARPVGVARDGRALSLGERKALARRPTRALMDRLLRDPHPAVIRTLLGSPRVTEDDVVRLAARRPAYPDIILEIARSPEWIGRARVRMSIVQNPGSPVEVAVPLVRLLIRPELLQVVAAADVPAVVRAAASELLSRRPPQGGTKMSVQ